MTDADAAGEARVLYESLFGRPPLPRPANPLPRPVLGLPPRMVRIGESTRAVFEALPFPEAMKERITQAFDEAREAERERRRRTQQDTERKAA